MNATTLIQLFVFLLAGFVGFQTISRIPPLLHTPLMAATNAISGISLVASLVLGVGFIAGAVRLYRRADRRSALRLYLYSLAYLALLFCAMVADAHL